MNKNNHLHLDPNKDYPADMTDHDFNPYYHTLVESLPVLYGTEKNGKTRVWVAKIYLKGKNKQ